MYKDKTGKKIILIFINTNKFINLRKRVNNREIVKNYISVTRKPKIISVSPENQELYQCHQKTMSFHTSNLGFFCIEMRSRI
jgi:hypothetical protein